ncbi:ABC transporter ATP-binding protein [Roseimaritima sediminicola]|uniref:ABC transporter ATP-binding protein n=1 Tax=Roseimaritima sediminicola TaxID=2662066 RepID=UPI00129853C6|nr:ATP-binding cassette domain-containing protein [Roseimaritima sediminicola]
MPAPTVSAPPVELRGHRLRRVAGSPPRALLRDVDLRLGAGQRVALSGPSGAGKSVLLRVLACLDPLDGGRLTWNGQPLDASAIPAYRAAVILLLQHPVMDSGTVEDQLRLPYAWRHHRAAGHRFSRSRALEHLRVCGRGKTFLDQPARRLSGGERQLVALLRALLLEPWVLLLDEPTSAMDREMTEVAQRWIAEWLADRPERSTIWVTHDRAQQQRIATVHWRLQAGKII